MLGLFSQSATAISGSVLLMFNHGVITAAFFLLIGGLERRRGTSLISDLRGLQGPAPVLAGIFTAVMLASIGVPGLSGFVSEYLVLIGTFATHPWWSVAATTGVIFAALYLLWAYQRVFHGVADGENATISDASTAEKIVLAPLLALIVVLGVYPSFALSRATNSVNAQAPATWVSDSTGLVK
jgi:NADH-quinone oxidoreductase subunit M